FNCLPTRSITRQLQQLRGPMPDDTTITRDTITSFATPLNQSAPQQDYLVNLFDKRITPARALLLCFALAAVCYVNSITNAFILDDILIVAANERIRHIEPLHFLFQSYWGDLNHAGIYRPLTIFTFSLEYPIWETWAPGFRITNLLLHV